MLKNDALYADKARQVSELAVDLVELLREEPLENWQFAAIKTGLPLPVYPTTCAKAERRSGKVLLRLGFNFNGRSRQPSVLRFSGEHICVNASPIRHASCGITK